MGEEPQGVRFSQLCRNATPRKIPLTSRLASFQLRRESSPLKGGEGALQLILAVSVHTWLILVSMNLSVTAQAQVVVSDELPLRWCQQEDVTDPSQNLPGSDENLEVTFCWPFWGNSCLRVYLCASWKTAANQRFSSALMLEIVVKAHSRRMARGKELLGQWSQHQDTMKDTVKVRPREVCGKADQFTLLASADLGCAWASSWC